MALSLYGYAALLILVGAPVSAIVAAVRAKRLFWEDLGIVVFPSIIFIGVGIFRPALHTGWAMFLWPIIIAVLSLYAFTLKTALDRRFPKGRRYSRVFAAVCMVTALVIALMVPPWYD